MKVRLKKQNPHEVGSVNPTAIQAESLTDIRPMDNHLTTPHQTPNRRYKPSANTEKPGL